MFDLGSDSAEDLTRNFCEYLQSFNIFIYLVLIHTVLVVVSTSQVEVVLTCRVSREVLMDKCIFSKLSLI